MTEPREPSLFEFIDALQARARLGPLGGAMITQQMKHVMLSPETLAIVDAVGREAGHPPTVQDQPTDPEETDMTTYETRAQVERGTVKPRYEDDAPMNKSAADSSPTADALGSLEQSMVECHAVVSELARRLEPVLRSPEDSASRLHAEEDPELRSPVRGAIVHVRASTWDLKNRISDLIDRLDV